MDTSTSVTLELSLAHNCTERTSNLHRPTGCIKRPETIVSKTSEPSNGYEAINHSAFTHPSNHPHKHKRTNRLAKTLYPMAFVCQDPVVILCALQAMHAATLCYPISTKYTQQHIQHFLHRHLWLANPGLVQHALTLSTCTRRDGDFEFNINCLCYKIHMYRNKQKIARIL